MTAFNELRVQQYSDSLEMLSQQKTPRLALFAREQSGTGSKALRMLSQVGATQSVTSTTRVQPNVDIDVAHDGRWVYPITKTWGTYVDDIDLLQTNINPTGAYTQSAVMALNRDMDDLFLSAFFGTSQTGETGNVSVTFPAANQIAVTEGVGAATGLNVEKLRGVRKLALEADVDLDMESIYMGIAPEQYDNLFALTQVVSTDFNERPVLVDGVVSRFMGINFVISNRLPTDSNGYRRCPVWLPSGMGKGTWKGITGSMRNDSSKQRNPLYVEAQMMCGFTRLEEAKCYEVKCAEA
jgi:hypothetical protein